MVQEHSSRAGGIVVPLGGPSLIVHGPLFCGHSGHGRPETSTATALAPNSARAAVKPTWYAVLEAN